MHYLSSSPTPIQGVLPPQEWVMRSVQIDLPERGSHWFLREGRGRRHNDRGHPLLTYRVKATEATGFRTRGEYNATRVLLEHHGGPFPAGTRFTNVCGLPQCLNPVHWATELPRYPWQIEVTGQEWQAVSTQTWLGATQRVVVRAIAADRKVHVVTIEPWARRLVDAPPTALCGHIFDPRHMPLADVPVTCTKGC